MANETKKQSADPLPYIVIFAILFFVALGVLTWTLGIWYKERQCALYPNIWCSDNWTCNNSCPTGYPGNQCFVNLGPTGVASCIFGPDAPGAHICFSTPTGPTGSTGGLSCDCPTGMASQANNCFAGCGKNLGEVGNGAVCCCVPGKGNCPPGDIPVQCSGTT